MSEPDWLFWAREIQSIAQTGLTFNVAGYDHERYRALQSLAARIMAARGGADPQHVDALFAGQTGYATPKVDVRGAVFRDHQILLVRETADHGRWTLPGGWADVNLTAAENIVKEVQEESGFDVTVTKLAAVWDRTRQGHTPRPFHAYKMFFLCRIIGGAARTSDETSEVGFFPRDGIPEDISVDRTLATQIDRMFDHAELAGLSTDYE